jgi:L,D-peptidoglycan transpeptidase YkuD (ErfK/YbiS/YcfS/YnhG family)
MAGTAVDMSRSRSPASAGRRLVLRILSAAATRGRLTGPGLDVPCVLGRAGVRARKREGDGATPRGLWAVRGVWWRRDQGAPPPTKLPRRPIGRDDGWCDAPKDPNYNRPIRHPYPASAERLWRDDRLYDRVIVLGHNDRPRQRYLGSAIFIHLARDDFRPTEGCLALRRRDLDRLARLLDRRARIDILSGPRP